jgi:alpha-glucuronidase
MRKAWERLVGQVDRERFEQVLMHLKMQEKEAKWWRDACLSYFHSFSKRPIPPELEQPAHDLEYYEQLTFPYAPGIKAKW